MPRTNQDYKRLFNAYCKDAGLKQNKVAKMFNLNPRYFSTGDRRFNIMKGIIELAEGKKEFMLPWVTCESCGYDNTKKEMDAQDNYDKPCACVKCDYEILSLTS